MKGLYYTYILIKHKSQWYIYIQVLMLEYDLYIHSTYWKQNTSNSTRKIAFKTWVFFYLIMKGWIKWYSTDYGVFFCKPFTINFCSKFRESTSTMVLPWWHIVRTQEILDENWEVTWAFRESKVELNLTLCNELIVF